MKPFMVTASWVSMLVLVLMAQADPLAKEQPILVLRGQVVEAGKSEPRRLALLTEDGKNYSVVNDTGGQAFYNDRRLLGRAMQIRGRTDADGNLRVLQVFSLRDGKLHDLHYWCEVCAIKRYSLERSGVCECCGGQMDLREPIIKERME